MDLTPEEIAWLGGWISADGSIVEHMDGWPRIQFKQTDRDPLDRMSALIGKSVSGPHAPTGWGKKQTYSWSVQGEKAVELLHLVWPWLSERYQERARPFMDRTRQRGRKLTEADVERIRTETGHGSGRRLAEELGVTDGLISNIRHGRSWS